MPDPGCAGKGPDEFGMFHEFPSLPGRSESEAFDKAMEQVDAAERLGLDVLWLAELHFEPRRSVLSAPHNSLYFPS